MSSHGTRNWNDIAAAARDLADVADACTGEGAHRLRGPTERLRKLLSTVDASRDEPTEADPLEWPEGVVGPDAVAAVADAGPKSVKLLAESHELLRQMAAQNAALYNQAAISCIEAESEVKELRALVGGRSAAPTREQDDERPDDSVRRTSLGAQRLVAAIDAHVAKTHEPLAAGKDPAVAAQLFSEDSIELLLKAREVVALLSRSAEPPEDDDIGRLRRERDSLARRCSVRFEETEAAVAVVRQYAARWTPDLDTGLWWRNDLRTSRPITSSEMVALRRALDDDDGVAAEPNEGHGDGA